jgi:hypothetical protein
MLKSISPDFLGADIFKNGFGLFGIVPEISLLGDEFFISYFKTLTVVVKDTSSRR